MIPISDDNPVLRTPVVTYGLLILIFATWFLVQGAGLDQMVLASSVCNYGMVPAGLTHRAVAGMSVRVAPELMCVVDAGRLDWLTPITSMFLHGGWGHILGNSLFLWIFGNNVEDSMGRGRFLVFYLVCGLAAAGAHVLSEPASPVPTVGASGAISGVLGAYLVLYPRVRVRVLLPLIVFFTVVRVPAFVVLILWFVVQLVAALPQLSQVNPDVSGGVAVWAHVGGFVAGVILVKLFENPRLTRAHLMPGKGVM